MYIPTKPIANKHASKQKTHTNQRRGALINIKNNLVEELKMS
jgi:hypothetical protein